MSRLTARIDQVNCIQGLCIISFDLNGQKLSMVSLDLDENVNIGSRCILSVNPSHVAIGKDFSGMLSYSNQLSARIIAIENGELLSRITLDISGNRVESLITVSSSKRLALEIGGKVIALIKATELSIVEVLP
ncbi:MAG: TOBE domain-containing protein [Campylobacterales bacterium]|nr:TOBE domain-containing protein [Campylobacterales bacterium]